MTLLAFIAIVTGKPVTSLLELLAKAPAELQPAAQAWAAELETDVTPERLSTAFSALSQEAKDIVSLHFKPASNPSDFA